MRLLVGDPVPLFHRATLFLQEQFAAKTSVHASDLVLSEAYYALQFFYTIPKAQALEMLAGFAQGSGVIVSSVALAVLGQPNLASAKPGFVDRLIHGTSLAEGHTLVTFEKAAKKLPATVVL
jgi:predicted nucleic-acid-binding protein